MSNDTNPTINNHHHLYPKPEAEYQEIIQNTDLFLEKLQAFHVFYATKFRIPTLGGTRLDLHQLFLEVTSRGGIEKVIADRRWKEVTGVFNFPTSITNASFTLRKFYLSLLYHFEQVYYFRKEKPSTPEVNQANPISNGPFLLPAADNGTADQFSGNQNFADENLVMGTIDGKFDDGYLVTVNVGSQIMKGVLYHALVPVQPNVSQNLAVPVVKPVVHRRRRKQQLKFLDPAHPKRNRSGYTFFYAEQYPRLRPLYKGQERAIRSKAISTKIGQLWSRLTDAEKQVYQDKGKIDKERYKAELLEYKNVQAIQ